MKPTTFTALLLLATGVTCWPAETNSTKTVSRRPDFSNQGLILDCLGYPTNLAIAFAKGQADACNDLTNSVLAIKTCGLPLAYHIEYEILLEKCCHVRTDVLGGCIVSEGMHKYIDGYDGISRAYIQLKFGTNIFDKLRKEAEENYQKQTEAVSSAKTYTIRAGDTLSQIAQQRGIKLKDLLTANSGVDPKKLRVGQKLKIPDGKTQIISKPLPSPN